MRSGFLFFTIVLVTICAQAHAYDWSTDTGDGSPQSPYQIYEPNHLMYIGSDPNLFNKHFVDLY